MNLKITAAVAVALACSASAAFASNVATTQNPQVKLVASGSSAERDAMLALMVNSACQAGTFDVYRISPSANQDFRAYSCTIQADAAFGSAAGKTATVYYRSEGGSAFGFAPIATNTQVMRLAVDNTCSATVTQNFSGVTGPVTIHECPANAGDYQLVGTTLANADTSLSGDLNFTKDTVQLGIGDEEPKMFGPPNFPSSHVFDGFTGNKQTAMNAINGGVQVGFGQVFGVVVNNGAGSPFNGVANISIGKQTLAGIFNGTYRNWNAVPTENGGRVSASSLTIRICRREPGSGTQVAANQYFLGTTQCAPPAAIGSFRSDGTDNDDAVFTNDTDGVIERGATGDLLNCVAAFPGGIGFATYATSGIPAGVTFIGINNNAPTREKAAAGTYDFWYELTYRVNATGDSGALANGLVSKAQISTFAPNTASVFSLPNENNDFAGQGPFSSGTSPIAYGTRSGNSCNTIAPVVP